MKYNFLSAIIIFCVFLSSAHATDCNLDATLLDLRDGGITFGTQNRAFIADIPEGDGCETDLQATGFASPRSSILREYSTTFPGSSSGNNFKRVFKISNPILVGQGSLSFSRLKFRTFSGGGAYYLLSLVISPGAPIPKGQTYSPNYLISGVLQTVNQAGAVTSSQQAFNPQYVNNGQEFGIIWNRGYRSGPSSWVNITTLEISFGGNNSENIINYDILNSQYTGELDFKPESETRGILYEQGLQAKQFKFKLGGYSLFQQSN